MPIDWNAFMPQLTLTGRPWSFWIRIVILIFTLGCGSLFRSPLYQRVAFAHWPPVGPKSPSAIRIGMLGASTIGPIALINPARMHTDVVVQGIAARDVEDAEAYAAKHSIKEVFADYQALLDADTIDLVYISVPNGLHYEWAAKAMKAGKHVLCEKPLANNAKEAEELAGIATETGQLLMVGYHNQYHNAVLQVKNLKDKRKEDLFGEVVAMEVNLHLPFKYWLGTDGIRHNYALGGGAMMDLGCYAISTLRWLADQEPTVISAKALISDGDNRIDEHMEAVLAFDTFNATISVGFEVDAYQPFEWATVGMTGSLANVTLYNFLVPHYWNHLEIQAHQGFTGGPLYGRTKKRSTYWYQLEAVIAAINEDKPFVTDGTDSALTMTVIDEIYIKAGMTPRGTE